MPILSLASARSLANSAARRVLQNLPFTAANISATANQGQLGGEVTRLGSVTSTWAISTSSSATIVVTASGASAYVVNGSNNATLTLLRGTTYTFQVNASGHPFWIQTSSGAYNAGNVYADGVTNNGAAVGNITFVVPSNAPSTLYYVCANHSSMAGVINIVDSPTVTLNSTGLPYHSYYNSAGGTAPSAQSHSSSWTYRGGTSVAGSATATGTSVVGYLLNGIPVYTANVGSSFPSTFSQVAGYNFNAAYESSTDLNYTFFQDNAGGYALSNGEYQYRDYSFSSSWLSGVGRAGSATVGSTGMSESSLIAYLQTGLFHPDGHSRILGIAADGYPIYGPYGYSDPQDSSSGVRRMLSGYALRRRDTRVAPATNVATYPMGIFVQDYAYTGYSTEILNINVSASGSSSYTMSQIRETENVQSTTSLGSNPSFVVPAGTVFSFNLGSLTGQPLWIKTANVTGISSGVTTGEIANNGSTTGTLYWHTGGVAPGTYYYISQNSFNMQGTITITSQIPADLDTNNGRQCDTPDFPGGTYAYFMTVDDFEGGVYPYIVGNTYYGAPASL